MGENEQQNGPTIRSVNIGRLEPTSASHARVTGHRKKPVDAIDVRDPGVRRGASGVAGDGIGDQRFHGGHDQALYAYARADLDRWASELGVDLPDGCFGENLTLAGLDPNAAVVGEIWRVVPGPGDPGRGVRPEQLASRQGGTPADAVELRVTHPRIPCRTFAGIMGQPRWVKRFTLDRRPGAYLRVERPGTIRPGDAVEVVHRPDHGVTIADLFVALTIDPAHAPFCWTAGADLTDFARGELRERMPRQSGLF